MSSRSVPTVYGVFEFDGGFITIPDYIDGVNVSQLKADDENSVVAAGLEKFLGILKGEKVLDPKVFASQSLGEFSFLHIRL